MQTQTNTTATQSPAPALPITERWEVAHGRLQRRLSSATAQGPELTPAELNYRWRNAPFRPWGLEPPWENTYPAKIEELYLGSPYFRRVTDEKAEQIAGEGLKVEGTGARAAEQRLQQWGITPELLTAAAYDIALFNGTALEVEWAAPGQIRQVVHRKIAHLRPARETAPEGPAAWYYTTDWQLINRRGEVRQPRYKAYAPRRIASFNTQQPTGWQLLYLRKYSPANAHFPLPEAESVYNELRLGMEVVRYQLHYIENGMTASAIAYVPYPLDPRTKKLNDEDVQELERRRKALAEELTGKMRAGQLSIIWFNPYLTDHKGEPVGVPRLEKPIEEKNEQKFIEVQRESRQAFLTGLGVVSGELYGIPRAGGFSSQSELLLTAHELTYNQLIRPKQQLLLGGLERLLRAEGYTGLRLHLGKRSPVTRQLSPEWVEQGLLTRDEFRRAHGLPPLEGEQ